MDSERPWWKMWGIMTETGEVAERRLPERDWRLIATILNAQARHAFSQDDDDVGTHLAALATVLDPVGADTGTDAEIPLGGRPPG